MRLEDLLDAGLAGFGRAITSGTGTRCSWVVLVVKELVEGVAKIRALLETQGRQHPMWIRFLDDSLAAEWVGVTTDAPPPSD
jgi:hypothetical protein